MPCTATIKMDAVKAERMELTRRLQEAIELHRKLQQGGTVGAVGSRNTTHIIRSSDMQKHEQAIKQFMQQQNECEMVKKVRAIAGLLDTLYQDITSGARLAGG